jgi:phage/plasmid-associated DNA primase
MRTKRRHYRRPVELGGQRDPGKEHQGRQVRSFPHYIPPGHRDPTLAAGISGQELPGIAAAVEGLRSLLARGMFRPVESASAQKQQFRRYSDHVSRFLEERVQIGAEHSWPRPDFYQAYRNWCEEEGVRPANCQSLLAAVRQHGAEHGVVIEERKRRGQYHVHGAALNNTEVSP